MHSYTLSAFLVFGVARLVAASAQSDVKHSIGKGQAVLAVNFPDPSLIQVDTNWYAFSTSGNGKNIQVASSPSFLAPGWKLLEDIDALPFPGAWTVNDENIWAPDVVELVS